MLLQRKKEADGTIVAIYSSSNILESKYNGKDLVITFKRGASYTYKDVTEKDYMRFESDESQGVAFNAKIKPKYEFSKNDVVDTTTIESEIDEAKKSEVDEFGVGVMNHMELVVREYKNSNEISEVNLKQISDMIAKYTELSESIKVEA